MPAARSRKRLSGELFAEPLHPYTRGLMDSIPRLDLMRGADRSRQRAPAGNSRHRAAAVRSAARLCLRTALRTGRTTSAARTSALRGEAARSLGGLLAQPMVTRKSPRPRGHRPQEAFPGQEGPAPSHGRAGLCRRWRQLHCRMPARRSAWSANPAAASRRSAARGLRLVEPTVGLDPGRRQGDHRPVQVGAAPLSPGDADHLPGPVLLARTRA